MQHPHEIEALISPIGLIEALEELPSDELQALASRVRVGLDPSKRITVEAQLARGLVALPHARNPALLPKAEADLIWRVAEASGCLVVDKVPGPAQPLIQLGLLFCSSAGSAQVLRLPLAYLAQMNSWEGDDPRGVRALVSQAAPQVAMTIASEYLGRTATQPTSLALEPALKVLMSSAQIRAGLGELANAERALLSVIEERGGEVDTEELLDLEKEPLRLRGAGGASLSRKGIGFALERRGFLIPVHPNHHIIPTEVAQIVGQPRRKQREKSRREIRNMVLSDDHAPRRATFAGDPACLALAFALAVHSQKTDVHPHRGTPKSLVNKFASRHGSTREAAAMISALSRAVGLWDDGALSEHTPPGKLLLAELGERLFQVWRKGGAWDEAREDGELLRVPSGAREASAVGVVRELMLEALCELGEGSWVPWEALAGYVLADARNEALTRLLTRWAQRNGLPLVSLAEIATRIGLQSLFVLGVADIGEEDERALGPAVRLTQRGKGWISGSGELRASATEFIDNHTLRLGATAPVWQILALAGLVEVGQAVDKLDLSLTPARVAAQIASGADVQELVGRLSRLAEVPDELRSSLRQASRVLGQVEFVASSGFVWVEDHALRELLQSRKQTMDLFIEPSPPGGLLLQADVSPEKLALRCRSVGVEVTLRGKKLRAKAAAPGRRVKRSAKTSG